MSTARTGRSGKKQILKKKRRMRVIRNRAILVLFLVAVIVLIIILIRSCHNISSLPDSSENAGVEESTGSISERMIEGTSLSYDDIKMEDSDTMTVKDGTVIVRSNVEVSDIVPSPSKDTDYIIRVNKALGCTTVYRLDKDGKETPVKAFACSVARGAHETPEGEYYLDEWYDWCYMADATYGQYAYRMIMGDITDIMFHSVPYLTMDKDSLEWADYDKLGTPASMGCVRMCVSDVKWICENVGAGVHVIIYSDSSTPGPLGKPDSMFIPFEAKTIGTWDPSDPDSDNPWHGYEITFDAPDKITVPQNSTSLDLTPYLNISDNYGNDLARYAVYSCEGREYGFSYSTIDQEDVPSYPDYTQSDMVKYQYSGMDISKPGTYDIVICISSGPVRAYRSMQVEVVE